ncbi:MAG: hypothetical protein ABGZ53_14805, partial [Fuerstiella sp.]
DESLSRQSQEVPDSLVGETETTGIPANGEVALFTSETSVRQQSTDELPETDTLRQVAIPDGPLDGYGFRLSGVNMNLCPTHRKIMNVVWDVWDSVSSTTAAAVLREQGKVSILFDTFCVNVWGEVRTANGVSGTLCQFRAKVQDNNVRIQFSKNGEYLVWTLPEAIWNATADTLPE